MDWTVMSIAKRPRNVADRGRAVKVVSRPPSPGTRSVIGPLRTIGSMRTPPSGRATMPSRAGSEPVGSTRYTSPDDVSEIPASAVTLTEPTLLDAGQLSAFSWVVVQCGAADGLPSRPGGRLTVTLRTSSLAGE